MALQTKISFKYGLEIEKAYCRITRFEWSTIDSVLLVQLSCHYNETARKLNDGVYHILTFSFNDIKEVSLKKMYELIKQTPEFCDALDV